MIFRRITANFRKQDWTAVAVELVIVVLGVFIGLQAQEWAAAHAEQQRADLEGERVSIKAYLDYQQVSAAYARIAIRGLASPGAFDPQT